MNLHALKSILISAIVLLAPPLLQAQFDDVYFDPDNVRYKKQTLKQEQSPSNAGEDYGVTYYDDDHYQYYDDYGYSSAPSGCNIGFGFSFPFFSFYSYPYSYYPGSSIYVNFGYGGYYPYNDWYGCGWGYYNPYYYGCGSPYYYGNYGNYYNNWGCNGYYSYGNSCGGGYYPEYYPEYYPGYYYGPRTTGNTGSSPRGPVLPPGVTQQVLQGRALADQVERPASPDIVVTPGNYEPSRPGGDQRDDVPSSIPATRGADVTQVTKDIPVDKELTRQEPVPGPKRPVFKPDPIFEPYPNSRSTEVASLDGKPEIDRPVYRPYNPTSTPTRSEQPGVTVENDKPVYSPNRRDQKPTFKPTESGTSDRSTYTPSTRSDDRPDYRPAPGNTDSGNDNDRPTYSPPPRSAPSSSEDRPSGQSRSTADRPDNSSRSQSPSHNYSPSRSSSSGSSHSSGGSSSGRSSGGSSSGGSSSGGSSPRGRG